MAKFGPGDEVMLRTERTASIVRVIKDSDIEKDVAYSVSPHAGDSMKELRIVGTEIARLLTDSELGRIRHKISWSEGDLLDSYKSAAFREWNRALREKKELPAEIALFQSVLTKVPKWSRAPVYRGLAFATAAELSSFMHAFMTTEIEEYTSPQFMSTHPDQSSALRYANGSYGVLMKILVVGRDAATVRCVTNNTQLGEKEVFFKHGATFDIYHSAESTGKAGPKYSIVIGEKGAKIDPLEAATWNRRARISNTL
jgi:hypothetical protein